MGTLVPDSSLAQSPWLYSDAYGENPLEASRPFRELLECLGYGGSQISELGDLVGGELYGVVDYVDRAAQPKPLFWSTSSEGVKRVRFDPARRAIPGKTRGIIQGVHPPPPMHPLHDSHGAQIDWKGVWGLRPPCIPDAHHRPPPHINIPPLNLYL